MATPVPSATSNQCAHVPTPLLLLASDTTCAFAVVHVCVNAGEGEGEEDGSSDWEDVSEEGEEEEEAAAAAGKGARCSPLGWGAAFGAAALFAGFCGPVWLTGHWV